MVEDLLIKFQSGDDGAFDEIVRTYLSMVVNLAFRFTGNQEDAEDLAQDIFVKVWNKASSFKGDASLKTWIYRITVNESLNFVRKRKIASFVDAIETALSFQSDDTDTKLYQSEEKNFVRKAIRSLPRKQRIAITLRTFKNLPYEEIASIMKLSVSSVESLLFRAKKNLKKKLMKYYFSDY
jgi:RNA polymerase sigma-70 factor (ECF subfamily)